MKTCSTCKVDKPFSEYNKKTSNKDGHERYCKDCHRIRNKKHYDANPAPYKEQSKKFKANLVAWFHEYKTQQKCEKCGEDKPWRLAFHHTDPSNKLMGVREMIVQHRPRSLIMEEIEKCIVVCHNCHADIHFQQYYRLLV